VPRRGADEHKRAGILTPGLKPRSRLPGLHGQWLWEFVTRYSGATVPDSHGVPCHLLATGRNCFRRMQRAAMEYAGASLLPSDFFWRGARRAHLSLLQAVAAGILPAVEGGILAARNERGSGRAT